LELHGLFFKVEDNFSHLTPGMFPKNFSHTNKVQEKKIKIDKKSEGSGKKAKRKS